MRLRPGQWQLMSACQSPLVYQQSMEMQWEDYKSPSASQYDEEFEIEIQDTSRLILEHYKATGEFREPLRPEPEALLTTDYESPTKKYNISIISKIQEVDEEQSNLESKKEAFESEARNFMMHTFAGPTLSQMPININYTEDETYLKIKMKLEQQFAVKEENMKREANQLLNKMRQHQKFIIELIFSLNLVERLENDLDTMLTVAEQNFVKYKDMLKQKEIEEQMRKQKQQQERQRLERERIEKQRLEREREQRQRVQRQRFEKQRAEIQKISRQSPTKLFKPANKGVLEFAVPRKSFTQNAGSQASGIRKSFIQNKNTTINHLIPVNPPFQSSPPKVPRTPRASIAFERRGSYVTASPKKQNIEPTQTTFQQQLQQKLRILSEGRQFKRICFQTQTVEVVDIYCSPDYKRLICRLPNCDTITEPMSEFIQVTLGRTSRNFQMYLRAGENPEDGLSFSILFLKGIIDLQALTHKDRQEFIDALYELRKMALY